MARMAGAIVESIVIDYGTDEFIRRISNPNWFQAFGAVLGMDWHSSGITTSVMGALKQSINPMSGALGLYVCGGRGKFSRQTPQELMAISDRTGLDGDHLVRTSKLTAKIDNTAIQDGYQLYLHSFILSKSGAWTVVQQGMNDRNSMARRYHWHSGQIKSFVDEPHTAIVGQNQGKILNLTDHKADTTRKGMLDLVMERPDRLVPELQKLVMPRHHEVKMEDFDLKRLAALLAISYDRAVNDFEELILLEGAGPKTLRSLALASEMIHGTPSRFRDPARFSFAQGGKDGHPYPVQTMVYDDTIKILDEAIYYARLGQQDKLAAQKNLYKVQLKMEKRITPDPTRYKHFIDKEINESPTHGGKTVYDSKKVAIKKRKRLQGQLTLF
jgi:hypothetical protein